MKSSSQPVLLTHAAQLLTLRGATPRRGPQMRDLGIIEDGAVFIEDGKISAVGTTDELRQQLRNWVPQSLSRARRGISAPHLGANLGIEEIDCRNKVVLPGFVDSHTHPVFAAPRLIDFEKRISGASYEEIAAAGGGIRASIRGVRESSADDLASHILQRAQRNVCPWARLLLNPNPATDSISPANSNRSKPSSTPPCTGPALSSPRFLPLMSCRRNIATILTNTSASSATR